MVVAWLSSNVLVLINIVALCRGPANTWMGDRLWVSKSSRYVMNHLRQLSFPSLQGR